MNNLFILCVIASAQVVIAADQTDECHHCMYVEDDPDQAACRLEFADLKVACSDEKLNLTKPYYCAKWVGIVEGKETIVRNCFGNGTEFEDNAQPLSPTCNFGKDHSYVDLELENAVEEDLFAGNLCICNGNFCNGAASMAFHASLIAVGLLTIKWIQ